MKLSRLALGRRGRNCALIALGLWLDARPVQLYAVYDFWHTSPNFFLVRVGVAPGDSVCELRVVPLGSGRVGLQSADRNGQVFAAGLLGAH